MLEKEVKFVGDNEKTELEIYQKIIRNEKCCMKDYHEFLNYSSRGRIREFIDNPKNEKFIEKLINQLKGYLEKYLENGDKRKAIINYIFNNMCFSYVHPRFLLLISGYIDLTTTQCFNCNRKSKKLPTVQFSVGNQKVSTSYLYNFFDSYTSIFDRYTNRFLELLRNYQPNSFIASNYSEDFIRYLIHNSLWFKQVKNDISKEAITKIFQLRTTLFDAKNEILTLNENIVNREVDWSYINIMDFIINPELYYNLVSTVKNNKEIEFFEKSIDGQMSFEIAKNLTNSIINFYKNVNDIPKCYMLTVSAVEIILHLTPKKELTKDKRYLNLIKVLISFVSDRKNPLIYEKSNFFLDLVYLTNDNLSNMELQALQLRNFNNANIYNNSIAKIFITLFDENQKRNIWNNAYLMLQTLELNHFSTELLFDFLNYIDVDKDYIKEKFYMSVYGKFLSENKIQIFLERLDIDSSSAICVLLKDYNLFGIMMNYDTELVRLSFSPEVCHELISYVSYHYPMGYEEINKFRRIVIESLKNYISNVTNNDNNIKTLELLEELYIKVPDDILYKTWTNKFDEEYGMKYIRAEVEKEKFSYIQLMTDSFLKGETRYQYNSFNVVTEQIASLLLGNLDFNEILRIEGNSNKFTIYQTLTKLNVKFKHSIYYYNPKEVYVPEENVSEEFNEKRKELIKQVLHFITKELDSGNKKGRKVYENSWAKQSEANYINYFVGLGLIVLNKEEIEEFKELYRIYDIVD